MNNEEMVQCLLTAGADPYQKDLFDVNALDEAEKRGHLKLLTLMKEKISADADAVNGVFVNSE